MQSRRRTIRQLTLSSAALVLPYHLAAAVSKPTKPVKLGVISDLHLGFVEDASDRLTAFLEAMKDEQTDALIQLGDFLFSKPEFQKDADRFNAAHEHTLHVIGNHDIRDHGLKRQDCLRSWRMPAPYYTQVVSGVRFIVLDGNEPGSPRKHRGYPSYIGSGQRDWLEQTLKEAVEPVIVLSHQPILGVAELDNAQEIRALLERYKSKIILCMNGHAHIDQHQESNGIHYLHVNSASYYWLGGKVRLARYKDPIFCTVTIDPTRSTITIRGKTSTWLDGTPDDVNYFEGSRAGWRKFVQPRISDRTLT